MRLPDPDVDHETPLLLLMVKDEVLGIERPLRSAAAIGIRDVLLVDTGSTDGTVARAHALAAELSLAIAVAAIGWPGSFAAARNACLDLAAALYPGRQALFLDADDEVSGTWAGPLPGGHPEARAVTLHMGDTSWAMPRVIRLTRPLPRYEGAVHEILRLADPGWLSPSGLTVRHHAGKSSRARWEEDRVVLEKEWRATGSARALFYWAQTLECLGNALAADEADEAERREDLLDEALSLYERRAEILDTEEAFVAELRACRLRDDPRFVGQPSRALLSRRLALHDVFPSRPEQIGRAHV